MDNSGLLVTIVRCDGLDRERCQLGRGFVGTQGNTPGIEAHGLRQYILYVYVYVYRRGLGPTTGRRTCGGHICACPDLPAVDILSVIR